MQDISKPIVAVRYMQTMRGKRGGASVWSDGNVGEMCEQYLDQAGIVDQSCNGIVLSDKAYHYFTDVPVEPGDVVIVRGGGDEVKLAVVDSLVADGTYRATRTIVGRVDFGPALAEKRREQERKALVKEIERRVRETQAKEEVMTKAEHYAATDPAIAEMLAKLKEMN